MLIEELLEEFDVGKYQRVQSIFMGAVFLVDGGAVMMSSAILGSLQEEWGFTNTYKGLMMSIMFVGIFVGTLLGGALADAHGRKKVVVGSYIGIILWTCLSVLANGPGVMTLLRFFLGISFGAGIPACVALVVESASQEGGKFLINRCSFWFLGGEVYVAALLLLIMPKLTHTSYWDWRSVTLLSVTPTLLALPFMCTMMKESPQYLLNVGRKDEALEVLTYITETNGRPDLTDMLVDLDWPQASESSGLVGGKQRVGLHQMHWSRSLCGPDVTANVIAGSFLCFMGNLFFYGSSYVLPQVFAALTMDIQPAMELMLVSLASFPGLFLVDILLLADKFSDRDRLLIFALLCFAFQTGITQVPHTTSLTIHMVLLVACALKSMVSALFNMVYIFLGRAFPATHRCTAMSFCLSVGRFGSILAPLLCEYSVRETKGPNLYFFFCATCSVMAVLVIRFLVQEFHLEAVEEPAYKADKRRSLLQPTMSGLPAPHRRSFIRRSSQSILFMEDVAPPSVLSPVAEH